MVNQANLSSAEQLEQPAAEKTELLRQVWGLTQDLADALAEGESEAVAACLDKRQICMARIDVLAQEAALLTGLKGLEETEQAEAMRLEQQELLQRIVALEKENTRQAAAVLSQVRQELRQADKNRTALAGYAGGSGFPAAGRRLDQKK